MGLFANYVNKIVESKVSERAPISIGGASKDNIQKIYELDKARFKDENAWRNDRALNLKILNFLKLDPPIGKTEPDDGDKIGVGDMTYFKLKEMIHKCVKDGLIK